MVYPDPIRISAKAAHTATILMLHGLGDSGAGYATEPCRDGQVACTSSARSKLSCARASPHYMLI